MNTEPLEHAVPATGRDAGVAWHYGDPLREQRLLASGAGVVDRSNRDVLVVPGDDRLDWLHSICSQYVSALHDGDSTQALVLSPHGHVEQHWQLTELADTVWIDTEPGAGADVLRYLTMMRFLKRVEPADVSAEWAVLSLVGPAAQTVLSVAGLPDPGVIGHAAALPDGGFVRHRPGIGDAGSASVVDLLVPRAARAATMRVLLDAGAAAAGLWAYEALRVEARLPRIGAETDHRTIPHEVDWIGSAVHLDKGCYRGQETVARVQNLGRPPRRLVMLHLAGVDDALPEPSTPVTVSGRAVGFLGTALHHHEYGPIALAVVKRSLPDDTEFEVDGQRAVADTAPAPAH